MKKILHILAFFILAISCSQNPNSKNIKSIEELSEFKSNRDSNILKPIDTLPEFKYNPNALKLGIIKKQKTNCPVCEKNREYVYIGPSLLREYGDRGDRIEGICPWCIKDGSAAKKYNGTIQNLEFCEEVDNEEFLTELTSKTPGYISTYKNQWLSHCGDFCAFENYVGWNEIKHLKEELTNDLNQIKSDYGLTQNELEKYLVNNSDFQGYLFKCIHCGKHRLVVYHEVYSHVELGKAYTEQKSIQSITNDDGSILNKFKEDFNEFNKIEIQHYIINDQKYCIVVPYYKPDFQLKLNTYKITDKAILLNSIKSFELFRIYTCSVFNVADNNQKELIVETWSDYGNTAGVTKLSIFINPFSKSIKKVFDLVINQFSCGINEKNERDCDYNTDLSISYENKNINSYITASGTYNGKQDQELIYQWDKDEKIFIMQE